MKHIIRVQLKKFLIVIVLSIAALGTGCSNKPECDTNCKVLQQLHWLRMFGVWDVFQYLEPCMDPPDYTMKPGDSILYKIPASAYSDYRQRGSKPLVLAGCSKNNWKLTIIPKSSESDISIFYRYHKGMEDKCSETYFVDQRAGIVSIDGSPGCLPGNEVNGVNGVIIWLGSSIKEDEFEIAFE